MPLAPALLALLAPLAPLAPGDSGGAAPEDVGWPVSAGAAPGYVPEAACAECHRALAESFAHVGMGRSLARVTPELAAALPAGAFDHGRSSDRFEVLVEDGALVQRRWREDADGARWAELEQRADWVIGSGAKVRTFLYRTPSGELFQLPLSLYSDPPRWRMSPGYDLPVHSEFSRPIDRQCLFCHAAYPEVPAGSDLAHAPLAFPAELPESIGCQRCHGPGAEHVERAADPRASADDVRASVVNPARLPRARRDDACFQCHLQPLSAVDNTVRLPGRGAFSYRPGEPLENYHVHFDVAEDRPLAERFEINHHPYRLRQSACREDDGSPLECLACHDPHTAVRGARRAAHYRAACVRCHAPDRCGLPMAEEERAPAQRGVPRDDCAACHMPQRRTEDVIQAVMTDHLIRRAPAPAEWLAPLPEAERVTFSGAFPYFEDRGPEGAELELLRELLAVRSGFLERRDALAQALARTGTGAPEELETWIDLASAHARAGELARAVELLREALRRFPEDAPARPWAELALARALCDAGRGAEALPLVERALARAAGPLSGAARAQALALRGRALAATDPAGAAAALGEALALRPNDAAVHAELAALLLARGDGAGAEAHLARAVALDPSALEPLRRTGDAAAARGAWADAVRAWDRADARALDDLDLSRKLAFALLAAPDAAARDDGRGLALARRAAEIAPRDPGSRALLALGLALAGPPAEAANEAAEAERLGADRVLCRAVQAHAARRAGSAAAARAAAREARAAAGEPAGPLRARALELLREGERER